MDFKELILRVLLELQPLVPLIFIALGVTSLLLLLMLIRYKKFKLGNSKQASVGLFFGLSKFNSLQLALVLLKAIVVLYYAIILKELKFVDYIIILVPCVMYCTFNNNASKILENFFWTIIQVIGLVASKLIYSYAFKEHANVYLKYLYFGIVIIMFIYTIYLFWNDIIYISNQRDVDPLHVFVDKQESENNDEER